MIRNIKLNISFALSLTSFKLPPTPDDMKILQHYGFAPQISTKQLKLIRWMPPIQKFCLNVDGAFKGSSGVCGGGGCIRDKYGVVLVAFAHYYGEDAHPGILIDGGVLLVICFMVRSTGFGGGSSQYPFMPITNPSHTFHSASSLGHHVIEEHVIEEDEEEDDIDDNENMDEGDDEPLFDIARSTLASASRCYIETSIWSQAKWSHYRRTNIWQRIYVRG
ncbi:hypothetical protein Taro_052112 [Colocasia esculenta]|uniref:RNase H type-1 domain-containing protein n=1 Tax=Colocasia esculenta TaxID=4460 RepID=A0A843XIV5_COLES|nr:hypothetical protein [Colocasia esculenta]